MFESRIEQAARVAHNINKAYCEFLGDHTQPDWELAPDWQKDSAKNGIRFHFDNPKSTPEDSHKSWLKQKEDEGWVYGPVKDPERKIHPCIVPYADLPQSQRVKDYLFHAVARSFA